MEITGTLSPTSFLEVKCKNSPVVCDDYVKYDKIDLLWCKGISTLCYSWFSHFSFLELKGMAQAKIIKKSVILFRVLNMTI